MRKNGYKLYMTIFKFENVRFLTIRAAQFCNNHPVGVEAYEREYIMWLTVRELTEVSDLKGPSRPSIWIFPYKATVL